MSPAELERVQTAVKELERDRDFWMRRAIHCGTKWRKAEDHIKAMAAERKAPRADERRADTFPGMTQCGCGDLYPEMSYEGGFIDAAGCCSTCRFAQQVGLPDETSNSVEFDGIGQPEPDGEVMDMWICESRSCVLRIGQLYRFKVDPTCSSCAPLAAEAVEAYGPIDARWYIDREPRATAPDDESAPAAANPLEFGGIGVPVGWEPAFDAMAPAQEELALKFCADIAGLKGERGHPPDPVRLLEMAQALYLAERNAAFPPAPTSERPI